ncbi:MAG: CRISPR-associated endonuclease Cas1 [Desulfurococcales archaeon]|nr:CRISPR-associated endonuclease Cas1 [Desulfurococcales archaeon]
MRMLVLDGYGVTLAASHGALVVREKGGGKRSIPLSEVDVVLVATSGVSVTSSAMRLLTASGVEMVVLDHRGMPVSILYSSHYTRTPTTRRAQYEAYHNGLAQGIIREIARAKIWNQMCTLSQFKPRAPREVGSALAAMAEALEQLDEAAGGGVEEARVRAMSLEAAAARAYWSGIAAVLPGDLGFDGRDQDAPDPVNAALNYGYGVLYGLAWRSLVLAGLDPYAGFLHVDRSGKPVLAFDYVEIFRAHAVDGPLVRLLLKGWRPGYAEGRLEPEARRRIIQEVNRALESRIHGRRLEEAIRGNALELARGLRSGRVFRAWRGCEAW